MTNPSRASSYSKSDNRAPSRAWNRPPRAVMHRRRNEVVEVAAGRGQRPLRGSLPSVRALYVGRDDRKKTGFWWHAMCDAAKHKNAARPESACRGSTVPAHRLVGAAGAVSAVVFGQAGVAKNTTCGKLALDPPTRHF